MNFMLRKLGSFTLLAWALFVLACNSSTSPPAASQEVAASFVLEIKADESGSLQIEPLTEYLNGLREPLADIAAKHQITQINAYRFNDNGFTPKVAFKVALPVVRSASVGEAGRIFGSVKKSADRQQLGLSKSKIQGALQAVDFKALLPQTPSACTDLNGLFKRLSLAQNTVALVLSDGSESCAKAVAAVESHTPMVVVILPQNARRSAQQFEEAAATILKAAPHAVVIPAFGDLRKAMDDAIGKVKRPPSLHKNSR